MPDVLLTGLADESTQSKRAEEQLAATRSLGLSYYSLRFIDLGSGVKNAMALTDEEIERLNGLHADFEVEVSSLASPLGKVKLLPVDDGSPNRHVDFEEYLRTDVARAIEIASALGTRLIRGFSFYPPVGDDPFQHVELASDYLREMAEMCGKANLYFGLEVEANLVGRTGELEAALYRTVDHPALGLVFDAGNLVCQGYRADEVLRGFRAMLPGLFWLHVKDYKSPVDADQGVDRLRGHVAEDALEHFVPADEGDSDHPAIFREIRKHLPELTARMESMGLPGLFVDIEPHLKGGGQFGGFSGPDGYGVALRALCRVLEQAGVGYQLTRFTDLKKPQG